MLVINAHGGIGWNAAAICNKKNSIFCSIHIGLLHQFCCKSPSPEKAVLDIKTVVTLIIKPSVFNLRIIISLKLRFISLKG
ncbi:MAG: hypothetical protein HRU28_09060 [Rhizobiales bacterium]|nr:hypothetical protein [Hyphomicrobiales bacterium]